MAGDPIYLELGGEQKEVRYTWKAIKRLRAEHDINLFGPDGDYEDPHTITAMLWAALVWDNDKLTLDQVDDMIQLNKVVSISETLGTALARDMGVEEKDEDPLP